MIVTDDDLKVARDRSAFTVQQGEKWVARRWSELALLAKGTVVIIDIATGEYVTGSTYLEASPRFTKRFGSAALGFVHRVGERSLIGGGIG